MCIALTNLFKQIENWLTDQLRPGGKLSARAKRRRLSLDPLEERLVPAVFNVNSLADILDPPAGVVTLRSAIEAANASPGGNVINLTVGGSYQITIPGAGENNNATGDFDILPSGGDLTIQNTSGQAVTVDGNQLDRVFNINPAAVITPANFTVQFGGPQSSQGFTITGGITPAAEFGPGSGGGIEDHGNVNVVLNNMVLTGNHANDDGGGVAMWNDVNASWTLTIANCTIDNNSVGDAGGGVFSNGTGKIVINAGTVISGNFAYNQGGGIWLDSIGFDSANLTVDGTVVSNNTAFSVVGVGGGLGNDGNGAILLTNSTIQNNSAGLMGGGFGDRHGLGSLTILDSLFLTNTAVGNGGGIATGGLATSITNSEIDANASGGDGGGLFADGTTLTVQGSTLANNTAHGNGAGIEVDTSGVEPNGSTIADTILTGNRVGGNGGGIDASLGFMGSLHLQNDTINANAATKGGGVFWAGAAGSSFLAASSIIAHNSASTGPDADNPANSFTDMGGNLIGVSGNGGGNTGFTAASTQTGTLASPLDPMLGPLQNNGPRIGAPSTALSLKTEIPLPGSPALGTGILTDSKGSTNTVLLASATTMPFGQPLMATATVNSGTSPSAPASGSVLFMDQGTLLATVPLRAGTATLSTSTLSLGGHSLSATYVGDASHAGSSSSTVTVTVGTSSERFVGALYIHLLRRQPDGPGLTAWIAALNRGVSRTQVSLAIEQSLESRTGQVQTLYQQLLHRAADPSGLNTFVPFLNTGGTLEQLSTILTSSPEYLQIRGGGTTSGFLTALYGDALNRSPDIGGLAAFTQVLNRGASRLQVAAAIFGSTEYLQHLVESYYALFLQRAADEGGRKSFVDVLKAGVADQAIIAAVLGSEEFFAKLASSAA